MGKPRTCNGCRAFEIFLDEVRCDLNYKQVVTHSGRRILVAPAGQCPKPRTIRKLVELALLGSKLKATGTKEESE